MKYLTNRGEEDEVSLTQKIAAELAAAQCLHQLDLELGRIADQTWQVFIQTTEASIEVTAKTDLQTAGFQRALLETYQQRRQYLRGESSDVED